MGRFVFLTKSFYSDYASCDQILQKPNRPHIQLTLEVGGCLFCIPFHSGIKHPYALFTDRENKCGIDFSKAVVITDPDRYIDKTSSPHIRDNEFSALLHINDYAIRRGMLKYISVYKAARSRPDILRNQTILRCSALQYFDEYIK